MRKGKLVNIRRSIQQTPDHRNHRAFQASRTTGVPPDHSNGKLYNGNLEWMRSRPPQPEPLPAPRPTSEASFEPVKTAALRFAMRRTMANAYRLCDFARIAANSRFLLPIGWATIGFALCLRGFT